MSVVAILCTNIRRVRLARDWSQELTAEKAGLAPRHFQEIEAGRREGLRLATIERIAKVLHVQVWQLLQPGRFPKPTRLRGQSSRRIRR